MSDKQKMTTLIRIAKNRMMHSRDAVHALDHVERVVCFAKRIGSEMNLSEQEMQVVVLAAWWHDVSRVMNKKTSLLWMPLLDDLLSAFLLWIEMVRCGLFGGIVGMATRIIFCKSIGTGAVFTRIFLRKRTRILLNIVKDADTLDTFDPHRTELVFSLVDSSWVYQQGYKVAIWWFLTTRYLDMKTTAAKRVLQELLSDFIVWLKQGSILSWHIQHYGEVWAHKNLFRAEALLQRVSLSVV